jgi:hypothetical protein
VAYHHFYKTLNSDARRLFHGLSEISEIPWDYLISPLELKLDRRIREKAEKAVKALYRLSRRPEYVSQLEVVPGVTEAAPANQSVLMAYDFHTTEEGGCHLVEVNTNASGFLLCSLMESVHSGTPFDRQIPVQDLRASFENEARLCGLSLERARMAISDDDVRGQKMYAEFLMYRDWFTAMGTSVEFVNSGDFQFKNGRLHAPAGTIDIVYNRCTDFYLDEPAHGALREAFLRSAVCLTPQPREYWLLADKQRLVQWSQDAVIASASPDEREAIQQVLLPTFEKSGFASEDEIWNERKNLFFKPKRSFGGKSVYRGESVSRKVFERLMTEDILIQRFQPAARFPADDPRSVLTNWKYDLRCYAYQDRIQLIVARIYQGQVTNFASPMGGFTRVRFV